MSSGFKSCATIGRPADEVWDCLTDWNRAPQWMSGIEKLEADDSDMRPGTRLAFRARGKQRDSVVRCIEPGRRLELESRQGGVTAVYRYTLTQRDQGTELCLDASCETEGVLWTLASPVIAAGMRRVDGPQPERLKELIERGS